jgi:DNA repair protein RecO (recombination protein O)
MIRLSRYLGFGPQFANEIIGGRIIDVATEEKLKILVKSDYTPPVALTNMQRREILDLLVRFYADHMENFGEIRSLQVLREIFS